MKCNPTLTSEEFKTIHNALWELDTVVERLNGVINQEMFDKLYKATNTIRKGLAGAYEQESKSFEKKNSHYYDVAAQLALRESTWSIYEVDDMSDRHPFEGADRIVYKDHWGKRPVSSSVHGMTWAALFVAANACIRDSGDKHHRYIERFTPDAEDPRTLILSTGS